MRVDDLQAVQIKVASPDDIHEWSHGEVTKPETINYRTQRPEKDGLFCEVIFGPEKDYQCYCGKYKRVRFKGVVCDRCGVEVTSSHVRRERMGHIKLACPVSHIWFLRGVPSRMGLVLNVPGQQLEKVVYFASYIVTDVDEDAKQEALDRIEQEYKEKLRSGGEAPDSAEEDLKTVRDREREAVLGLKKYATLSEMEYRDLSMKYGHVFTAGTGAEALQEIFSNIDLEEERASLKKEIEESSSGSRKKKYIRLRLLEGMQLEDIDPSWMFLTVLPVLPPDLRPMVQLDGGRFASSDLNDLYRRVINRNNRLKYLLDINAPEVIVRNEKRMLQEAVDALIDNNMRRGIMTQASSGGRRLLKSIADMLKGKQGRFRQNLLGKRVDYSGRSVIVVGPDLQLHQCGLPKKMALELFKPFVMRRLLDKEYAYNLRGAQRLIDEESDEVWEILEEVVHDKLVLLNRAPTLHRLGIQAFEPILIEGEAIRIHPLVCKAYNADFDGDQMAVHLPLSEEAQNEARQRMLASRNLLKPATGRPIATPTQDMVMGCYWVTSAVEGALGEGMTFPSPSDVIRAEANNVIDLRAKVKVPRYTVNIDGSGDGKNTENANGGDSKIETTSETDDNQSDLVEITAGRILFNEVLPAGYPFQNRVMSSGDIDYVLGDVVTHYTDEEMERVLDRIKELGYEYATLSGISWGMDDLVVPEKKHEIIEESEKKIGEIENQFGQGLLSREERRSKIIEVWTDAKDSIEEAVPTVLDPLGPTYTMVDSGARGSWTQIIQMCGMKGLVQNPAGQIMELPVRNSFKEGFNVLEYFISTHGARKGTADTALRTSTAGYLTRRLIDVSHDVIVTEDDCGDEEGFRVYRADADAITQNFVFKIVGRVAAGRIQHPSGGQGSVIVEKGKVINWEKAEQIRDAGVQEVSVFTPLTCRTRRGVCCKCYGWDLGHNEVAAKGAAVGIVAAQAIGEPGTQLTMRTFHTGGVAGGGDITLGLPRVEEIFEVRSPGGKAPVSHVSGTVAEVTNEGVVRVLPSDTSEGGTKKGSRTKEEEMQEYEIPPNQQVLVTSGEKVEKGQQLAEGSLDLRELFRLVDIEHVWRYVTNEVQKIYASQGVTIHDKHIEIAVRQMFSRVRVNDSGDSRFIPGQVVELDTFLDERERLEEEKQEPPKGKRLLQGISRVALTTDSWLSAASFQETSRVLIKASLEGKVDPLRGLKENVILGKLIPAGTGFRDT